MKIGKKQINVGSGVPATAVEASAKPPAQEITVEETVGGGVPLAVRRSIEDTLFQQINVASATQMQPDILRREIGRTVVAIANEQRIQLNAAEQTALAQEIFDDMTGAGPLEQLLKDDSITDIMVNGPDNVFIEKRGRIVKTPIRFRDAEHVKQVAQRIARQTGRRLDEMSPMVDARLPGGARVNAVIPPISLDGTLISIRRFPQNQITLRDLVSYGSISEKMRQFLEIAGKARLNILISGGTSSGKTTLMSAISRHINSYERIITIEDLAELRLQQPHILRLETRPAGLEGQGEVDQRDLVKNALRMRPDRIIVGEVRHGEAFDMLQAMNTGHDGSMSTIHANTPRDALVRLENLVLMAGYDLPARAIRGQIVSAVDLIVQIGRQSDGSRRVTAITEVTGMDNETVVTQNLFSYELKELGSGQTEWQFVTHRVSPRCVPKLQRAGLANSARALFVEEL